MATEKEFYDAANVALVNNKPTESAGATPDTTAEAVNPNGGTAAGTQSNGLNTQVASNNMNTAAGTGTAANLATATNPNTATVTATPAATPAATPTTDGTATDLTATDATTPAAAPTYGYDTFAKQNEQAINDMYAAQLEAQQSQLESAYNQSVAAQQRANDKLAGTYQAEANAYAANANRNRMNYNTAATLNGLNTGAAGQANLSFNNSMNSGLGDIRGRQSEAVNAGNQALADLETKYQADVSSAIANNNYAQAAALLDEYKTQQQQAISSAETLAQYGDFSGYAAIYGEETAAQMLDAWNASNPDLAYRVGNISAKEYKRMTGKYPKGFSTGGGGGYITNPTPTADQEYVDKAVGAAGSDNSKADRAKDDYDTGRISQTTYDAVIAALA